MVLACYSRLKEVRKIFEQWQKRTSKLQITQAAINYDEVYDLTAEGSVKEFLRTCKKVGLDYNYGGG